MGFRILEWISGFQIGFLDFTLDFWISQWISGFHSGFLDFSLDFWISGFQFGFLPTVYEISFVTDPSVSAFVRRLERTFRVAHGCDKLGPETRSIFLFGQMQGGLRQDLMRSPSVSGALSYQELCMAAKNEEKRPVSGTDK